jgi:hypothetical protein
LGFVGVGCYSCVKVGSDRYICKKAKANKENAVSNSQKTCIGEDTSEQLDIITAVIQVLVHAGKNYVCKQCEDGVQIARCWINLSLKAMLAKASCVLVFSI